MNNIVRKLAAVIYLPMAKNINPAGRPNASGKHESFPKQCTSCLNSGATNVETNELIFTTTKKIAVKFINSFSCWGRRNWSAPKGNTLDLMPPVPMDMKNKPRIAIILKNNVKIEAYKTLWLVISCTSVLV